MPRHFTVSVIAGAALVAPFMILESVNTEGFRTAGFPGALFVFMWLLGASFLLTAAAVVQRVRTSERGSSGPLKLLTGVALSIAVAWFWIGLVVDQMPCFLGVPNCD
jgi:hypothetical protein